MLGKLAKLARGKVGSLDEVLELCSSMGVEVDLKPVKADSDGASAVQQLAALAVEPGARFLKLEADTAGQKCFALVVLQEGK